MRSLLALGLLPALLLQDAAPEEQRPDWPSAFAAFRAAVDEGDAEAAQAASEAWLDSEDASERQRAALCFGLGLVAARGEDPAAWPQAVIDFQDAAALAGPGPARLDALYDAGLVQLQDGERLRATIPEIAGSTGPGGTPMLAPPGPGGLPGAPTPAAGAASDAPPDPLPLARAAYQAARGLFVQRLRSDWRDADTRANLELVQRRLRELDEIERQREEQQEQQQQEQQDSGEGQDQQQDGEQGEDDQEDGEQGEEQQDQDGERQPNQEDPSGEEAREEPSPEEQAAEDEQQQEQQEAEQQEGEQQQQEPLPEQGEDSAASQLEDQERHLTREETMRLLDRLAELEAQARALEARLRRAQRESVERDW